MRYVSSCDCSQLEKHRGPFTLHAIFEPCLSLLYFVIILSSVIQETAFNINLVDIRTSHCKFHIHIILSYKPPIPVVFVGCTVFSISPDILTVYLVSISNSLRLYTIITILSPLPNLVILNTIVVLQELGIVTVAGIGIIEAVEEVRVIVSLTFLKCTDKNKSPCLSQSLER